MYIDIISYDLAEGVSEEQMLAVTEDINKEWQESSVNGFHENKLLDFYSFIQVANHLIK